MESILDAINEWIKEILIGAINGNLSTMFGDVNEKVGTIAAEVGKTPQGWNANIFNMIQNLSENVIVPIAGLVITYVLCYELISMVTEKNNMHDVDTFMFFKWFFKAFVAVFLVTHTFDITMAVFDMAQHIVSGAAGVIGGDTNIDVTEALAAMQEGLKDMEIPELLLLVMETSLVSLCMKIMSVLITVFFLLKDSAGTSLAAMVMIVVMLPCFLVAMYEKHGQPLEVVIKNIVQTKFTRPKVRPYQTENLYALLEKQRALEKEVSAIVKRTDKKDAGSRRKQA